MKPDDRDGSIPLGDEQEFDYAAEMQRCEDTVRGLAAGLRLGIPISNGDLIQEAIDLLTAYADSLAYDEERA